MGLPNSALIPIAALSAIVGVSLIFVVWWFPRTWARGNAEEHRIMQLEIQEREAYMAQVREQQAVSRRPEDEETGSMAPPSEDADQKPPAYVVPPKPAGYVAPVTPY